MKTQFQLPYCRQYRLRFNIRQRKMSRDLFAPEKDLALIISFVYHGFIFLINYYKNNLQLI